MRRKDENSSVGGSLGALCWCAQCGHDQGTGGPAPLVGWGEER
jgi:hypothetical protein